MKVNILILGSPFFVTVILPEGVSFIGWCKNIKADGGVFSDQLHIPYDKIIAMGQPEEFQMVQPANAPTVETKQ